MKALEEKIRKYGKVLPGDVLKIDNFLNHQIDVKFMEEIGEEFYRLFKDQKVDKILTIESSGIIIAANTAKYFDYVPVVFAKKTDAANMSDNFYESREKSYTRGFYYNVRVSKEFLKEGENVLIIDDFLARGEAMTSLIDICKKAKVNVVGCGAVVSKTYQEGEERIKKLCNNLHSLARVSFMNDEGEIEFVDDFE